VPFEGSDLPKAIEALPDARGRILLLSSGEFCSTIYTRVRGLHIVGVGHGLTLTCTRAQDGVARERARFPVHGEAGFSVSY
jgi:hypothetical protein